MRFVLRALGFVCLAGAFVVAVFDGARAVAAGALRPSAVETVIGWAAPNGLAGLQAAAGPHLPAALWDPLLSGFLATPAVIVLGLVGLVLLMLGRARSRRRR
jgi:hypothetical protein